MEFKDVFEPILNFVKSLQKKDKEQASKKAAKDRLKLVLMQDRASVSPDFFEMMKQEIIDVIKKYIEIDEEALEVQLTRGIEAGLEGPALYANIPIKNVKPVAPKGDEKENIDNSISAVLSEEEAEVVANNILENIESFAQEDKNEKEETQEDTNIEEKKEEQESKIEVQESKIEEEEIDRDIQNIEETEKGKQEKEEKTETKKVTRKRTSTATTKASAAKKKSTSTKATMKKTKT